MARLPAARVRSRDAKDHLTILGSRARSGARFARRIARGLVSLVLISVAIAYVLSWLPGVVGPGDAPELPEVIDLGSAAGELEIVERPFETPSGPVMMKTLARKRKAPAPAPSPVVGSETP